MKLLTRPALIVLAWFATTVLVSGCKSGPKTYVVKGKVTKGGALLKGKPPLGRVRVTFVPLDDTNKPDGPQEAVVNHDDGTFKVPGPKGKGILPGKYRICVYDYDPFPQKDLLNRKFAEDKSPIVREVTQDGQEIDLDVSKPTG